MSTSVRHLTVVRDEAAAALAVAVRPRRRPLVDVALCCSLAGGLAHLVGAPEHLRTWPVSGVFFAVLGVAQAAYAAALYRGRRDVPFLSAGIAGTVAVVVLYVVSRTAGLPFTPPVAAHGGPLLPGRSILPGALPPVGAFDLFTLAVELGVVVCLLALLPVRPRRRAVSGLMWTGATLWALAFLGVLA